MTIRYIAYLPIADQCNPVSENLRSTTTLSTNRILITVFETASLRFRNFFVNFPCRLVVFSSTSSFSTFTCRRLYVCAPKYSRWELSSRVFFLKWQVGKLLVIPGYFQSFVGSNDQLRTSFVRLPPQRAPDHASDPAVNFVARRKKSKGPRRKVLLFDVFLEDNVSFG